MTKQMEKNCPFQQIKRLHCCYLYNIYYLCIIDKHIHLGYEIYERGTEFEQYIESRLQLIDIPNKDDAYLRERLYEMYENPVKNYQAALTKLKKEQL